MVCNELCVSLQRRLRNAISSSGIRTTMKYQPLASGLTREITAWFTVHNGNADDTSFDRLKESYCCLALDTAKFQGLAASNRSRIAACISIHDGHARFLFPYSSSCGTIRTERVSRNISSLG